MSNVDRNYWMSIALSVSRAATCPRRHVGAILVRDNRLLTSGFNGAPSGLPECDIVGCDMHLDPTVGHDRCRRAKHAEENVIATAARYGIATDGAHMYVTFKPCTSCAGLMINAGISGVSYYNRFYSAKVREERIITEDDLASIIPITIWMQPS